MVRLLVDCSLFTFSVSGVYWFTFHISFMHDLFDLVLGSVDAACEAPLEDVFNVHSPVW